MAKAASKARESRVNIVISDGLKGQAEPELPFRILVMGDYTGKADSRPIDERAPVDINKGNFDAVMQQYNLSLDLTVPDRESGGEVPVSLKFNTLKDFRPEAIANQVPHLKEMLEVREAIKSLRTVMGQKAAVKQLMEKVKDPGTRDRILQMLSSGGAEAPAPEATADAEPAAPEGGSEDQPS
jgi:type VI secretion system protein ImpB